MSDHLARVAELLRQRNHIDKQITEIIQRLWPAVTWASDSRPRLRHRTGDLRQPRRHRRAVHDRQAAGQDGQHQVVPQA